MVGSNRKKITAWVGLDQNQRAIHRDHEIKEKEFPNRNKQDFLWFYKISFPKSV